MNMTLAVILVNFKAYNEASGKNVLKLARICDLMAEKYKVDIVIALQYTNIKEIKSKVKIPVFGQHIDPIEKLEAYAELIEHEKCIKT